MGYRTALGNIERKSLCAIMNQLSPGETQSEITVFP